MGVDYRREQVPERLLDPVVNVTPAFGRRVDPRAEQVRGASAAKGQSAVGCSLAVDDHVPGVAERGTTSEADLVPDLLGKRFGGHHQRVDGGEDPTMTGQVTGVALGGSDHHLGPYRSPFGDHPARLQ